MQFQTSDQFGLGQENHEPVYRLRVPVAREAAGVSGGADARSEP